MVGLSGLQASGGIQATAWRPGAAVGKSSEPESLASAGTEDRLEISARGRALAAAPPQASAPLPVFGRFELGGAEPLPFGPDQNATILNSIPGQGYRQPANGVDLGHQPARGLNILA